MEIPTPDLERQKEEFIKQQREAKVRVVDVVPSEMIKLIRMVVKAIYQPEQVILIDYIIHWECVKEEDLHALTGFDKRTLTAITNTLKNDRVLKEKSFIESRKKETGEETRNVRVKHWYINYKSIINIIKYKLWKVKNMIDKEVKDSSNRAAFHCTRCSKRFNELDIDRLYNPMSDQLNCTYCEGVVIEDENRHQGDVRQLALSFAEHTEKLQKLLNKLDFIRLHPNIVDPQRGAEIPHLIDAANEEAARQIRRAKSKETADSPFVLPDQETIQHQQELARANAAKWKQSSMGMKYDDSTKIETLTLSDIKRRNYEKNLASVKEVPIWMRVSTVKGADKDALPISSVSKNIDFEDDDFFDDDEETPNKPRSRLAIKLKEDIIRLLRQHEKMDENSDSENSDSENEDMEDDDIEITYPSYNEIPLDLLLKNPVMVASLKHRKIEYGDNITRKYNISFMF